MEAGASGQPEQQRLGLVTPSMGSCDGIYPVGQHPLKAGIPQAARPVLPRPGLSCLGFQLSGMEHPQRQAQLRAGLPHKSFVPVGRLLSQAVVDMADTQHKAGLCL